ncbi:MAG: fasciclin domain-containing protein [Bacteroidota bacterium]
MFSGKLSLTLALVATFFLGLSACEAPATNNESTEAGNPPKTIAETAAGDERFSTLVSLLDRVNLVDVLANEDAAFTVFAPTNAAFTAAGIDASQLTDEEITEILLYHVIGGSAIESKDLPEGKIYASTAAQTGPNGTALSLLVERKGGEVTLNNTVKVAIADLEASNGTIHAIDGVLLPLDVVGHAIANDNFSTLVQVLTDAPGGLVPLLQSEGPFTVFAPVNEAFEEIKETVATLSGEQVAKVLTYHVVGGANVLSTDLTNGQKVGTANTGQEFTVNINEDSVTLTDAAGNEVKVVATDVQATNGVIHVISNVLLPSNL